MQPCPRAIRQGTSVAIFTMSDRERKAEFDDSIQRRERPQCWRIPLLYKYPQFYGISLGLSKVSRRAWFLSDLDI